MNLVTNKIRHVFDLKEKIACVTLDFEEDYGDRVGRFNILSDRPALENLSRFLREAEVPVSAFVVTKTLLEHQESLEIIKTIARDYHCHSHTHRRDRVDNAGEIAESLDVFQSYFGYQPLGYRVPLGQLRERDVELLRESGFKFSASVFPSVRPGRFNNLALPLTPFVYENGLLELPFAALEKIRFTVALSYLKLFGWSFFRLLNRIFELPGVVVFNFHLHDCLVNEASYAQLPISIRMAYRRNKYKGLDYFRAFLDLLRDKGYRFLTMTELYELLTARAEAGD